MKLDINYIANLARLQLTAKEKRRLGPQLRSILSYFEKIAKLKTGNIPPTFQTTGISDMTRKDTIERKRSLNSDQALANAPERKDNLFKVPKVF